MRGQRKEEQRAFSHVSRNVRGVSPKNNHTTDRRGEKGWLTESLKEEKEKDVKGYVVHKKAPIEGSYPASKRENSSLSIKKRDFARKDSPPQSSKEFPQARKKPMSNEVTAVEKRGHRRKKGGSPAIWRREKSDSGKNTARPTPVPRAIYSGSAGKGGTLRRRKPKRSQTYRGK